MEYNTLGYATNPLFQGEDGVLSVGMSVDEKRRPLLVSYPNGQTETFAYDGLGHLTNHVDVAGRVSRYAYRVGELVRAERLFGPAPDQAKRRAGSRLHILQFNIVVGMWEVI